MAFCPAIREFVAQLNGGTGADRVACGRRSARVDSAARLRLREIEGGSGGLMRLRRPKPWFLAIVSAVWIFAGFVGAVMATPIIIRLLSGFLTVLSAGLWLGVRWVRIPLAVYWSIVTVAGLAGLFIASDRMRQLPQLVVAGYSAYLLYRWDPDARDEDEIITLDVSGGSKKA